MISQHKMKGTGHGQIFLILIRVLTVTCLDKKYQMKGIGHGQLFLMLDKDKGSN